MQGYCITHAEMKQILAIIAILLLLIACSGDLKLLPSSTSNPRIALDIDPRFPPLNPAVVANLPTRYGVALGQKLFEDKKLSGNNTISCADCHQQGHAFADQQPKAQGVEGRVGLRNVPPIQNMAFMQFYNWDGHMLMLEKQALIPIITHEEMNSSMLQIIGKIRHESGYKDLFAKAYGDPEITAERIFRSLAQYQYTLISDNSKYDQVMRGEGATFTPSEARGQAIFAVKCGSCHSGALFTDQSFRNIGFPYNPDAEEVGRARITGLAADHMRFRVPSLRNAQYTAPYGSFGQFATLRELLDYLDEGVLQADNLDPILQVNANRIPLRESEKQDIIAFIYTLSDPTFVGR